MGTNKTVEEQMAIGTDSSLFVKTLNVDSSEVENILDIIPYLTCVGKQKCYSKKSSRSYPL